MQSERHYLRSYSCVNNPPPVPCIHSPFLHSTMLALLHYTEPARKWTNPLFTQRSLCFFPLVHTIRVFNSPDLPQIFVQRSDFFCHICSDKQPTHVVRVCYTTSHLSLVLDSYPGYWSIGDETPVWRLKCHLFHSILSFQFCFFAKLCIPAF